MAETKRKRPPDGAELSSTVLDRYTAALRRYLMKRLRKPEDIPDLTQEIFERFIAKAGRPDVIRKPLTYLYAIAAHAVVDRYIGQQREQVDFDSELAEETAQSTFDSAHPDPVAEQMAMRRDITNALASLPKNHLAALILVKRDGLSTAEAARQMNLSEITVRGYVSEARHKLRRILEDYARERTKAT